MRSIRVNTLGKRVRYIRQKRGFTQKELAKKIYASPSAIGYWERDESLPTADLLKEIAVALDISSDYLLGIIEEER